MENEKIFVSLARPADPELLEWAQQFADALRSRGVEVTEEWSVADGNDASIEAGERGLRESDLIVSLLANSGATSPTFYFDYGVAIAGDKRFVTIVPVNTDIEQLPVPIRGHFVIKGSPSDTARDLLARYAERRSA